MTFVGADGAVVSAADAEGFVVCADPVEPDDEADPEPEDDADEDPELDGAGSAICVREMMSSSYHVYPVA